MSFSFCDSYLLFGPTPTPPTVAYKIKIQKDLIIRVEATLLTLQVLAIGFFLFLFFFFFFVCVCVPHTAVKHVLHMSCISILTPKKNLRGILQGVNWKI